MEQPLEYEIHAKENTYFIIKVIAAICGYLFIFQLIRLAFTTREAIAFLPLLIYVALILIYLFFRLGVMIGYLKGNAVKVSKHQFPEIYEIVVEQSNLLGLKTIPDVYLLQNGGILNAFATRFFGSDYVVIYSDVLEEAFEDNIETVRFILGHELGHVKRKHMLKSIWLFPSFFIPFLNSAYSRACEYTCDNIGAALSNNGARPGLLLLASGKKLWKKVNTQAYIDQEYYEGGFWFWFAEKVSSHPRLTKRIGRFWNAEEMNAERKLQEVSTVIA
ncbi:MAG TPA: M48 family metallopeptidase [Sphingobacteriaceae bacterium]